MFARKREIRRRHAQVPEALRNAGISPLLQRIYANRSVSDPHQVSYALDHLLDFAGLKGIDSAARIVADAIESNRRILIVGDYDADGATSTAVVLRALDGFGYTNTAYLVPNRFEYGYGLTPEIVELAVEQAVAQQPHVLITVDNGISSIEGVDAAKKHGMQVVVTDHHLPARQLPAADAIVNPNQPGCEFPSKAIAGVGVAFYLMLAVRAELRVRGWFDHGRKAPNMASLLDLVALGTVADVVPLDQNNRILVEFGLRRIRSGRCNAGIRALFEVAGRDDRRCSSSDLGFSIAPRLNAAGRLDDMSAGIECLRTDSMQTASRIAAELNSLNLERRQIEQGMLSQALDSFDRALADIDDAAGDSMIRAGLCLFDEQWHQGVIGLLAARIKERFHRPVIAFAESGDAELKGSARSIQGLHIRDTLDAIATRNPGLITRFGGHAMAAGLSLQRESYEEFREAFEHEVEARLSADDLQEVLETDGDLQPQEMTLETAEILCSAGPWGQHFPEPVFDDEFEILSWKIVGEKHLKMQLRQPGGAPVDAIAFNTLAEDLPASDRVRAAYRMDVNEFRNRRSLQLIVACLSQPNPS